MAQLVERYVRNVQATSSNLVISTIKSLIRFFAIRLFILSDSGTLSPLNISCLNISDSFFVFYSDALPSPLPMLNGDLMTSPYMLRNKKVIGINIDKISDWLCNFRRPPPSR